VEDLLNKIEELETKLGEMIGRYQSLAESRSSEAPEEVERMRAEADRLRQENKEMKGTLDKVRQRVVTLLERVDQMPGENDKLPSLF